MTDDEVLSEQPEKPKTTTVTVDFGFGVELGATTSATVTAQASLRAFQKPPEDHPVYASVGKISSEWANLEHRLDEIIWSMIPKTSSSQLACLTGQMMGHVPRYNAILALIANYKMSSDIRKTADDLRGYTSKLSDDRNRAIHDVWYVDAESSEPHQYRTMPKNDLRYGIFPPTNLTELLEKIQRLIVRVDKLAQDIRGEMPP